MPTAAAAIDQKIHRQSKDSLAIRGPHLPLITIQGRIGYRLEFSMAAGLLLPKIHSVARGAGTFFARQQL
jgi:hypothetical protein